MHEGEEVLWCVAPLASRPVGRVINDSGWEDLQSQCQMPSFLSSVQMVQIYRLKMKAKKTNVAVVTSSIGFQTSALTTHV